MNNQMTQRELEQLKKRITALEGELTQLKADVACIETRLDSEEAVMKIPALETIAPKVTRGASVSGRNVDRKRCYQEVLQKLEQLGVKLTKDETARTVYYVGEYPLLLRFSKGRSSGRKTLFFFGFSERLFEQVKGGFIVFCCDSSQNCFVIPGKLFIQHRQHLYADQNKNFKINIFQENNQSILYLREGIQIDIAEYLNNYEQLRSPTADIAISSPEIVASNPLRQFRVWLRKMENGESQLPQLPIETFHAGLKWMLEQGEHEKILKLKGKIPEDMAIKGIFLVAKRHVDAALLE